MCRQPSANEGRSRSSNRVREWFVAISGGATLAFTAWGLGGVQMWTLHVLLVGGLLTLSSAVFNIRFSKFPHFSLSNQTLRRLILWPPFWFSFLFLFYLLIGALNPAAEVVRDERGWWVEAVQAPLATWLPTSVRSDYQPMNAWRVLVSLTAAFTLIWGLWAGLTRRKPVLLVLWCLLLSGAGMGLVAILQHLTEARAVLWTFPSSNKDFWGSFFYRNQATAYLNLILLAAGVLYFYYAKKCFDRGQRSGPHFLLFGFVLLTAVSVGLALSRGGIIFGAALLALFIFLAVVQQIRFAFEERTSIRATVIALVVCSTVVACFLSQVDTVAVQKRFEGLQTTLVEGDVNQRTLVTRATFKMGMARMWTGWGAGSFRYVFPMYQREYPEIFFRKHVKHGYFGRLHWRYAHNDIVQFFAEYGIIGFSLLLFFILSLVGGILWHSAEHGFAVFFALAGLLVAVWHATIDFIFSSPAYWMAFIGLIVMLAKLLFLSGFCRPTAPPKGRRPTLGFS